MNLIDEIQYILERDSTIRSLLSFEEDEMSGIRYPSIAQETVPEGMRMPYLCIRTESDLPDGDHLNRLLLSFDVFAENNPNAVDRVALRIEQLFDRRKLMPFAITGIRSGIYPIPSGDPSIKGKNTKILYRYPREDLAEEDSEWDTNTVPVYVQVLRRT